MQGGTVCTAWHDRAGQLCSKSSQASSVCTWEGWSEACLLLQSCKHCWLLHMRVHSVAHLGCGGRRPRCPQIARLPCRHWGSGLQAAFVWSDMLCAYSGLSGSATSNRVLTN